MKTACVGCLGGFLLVWLLITVTSIPASAWMYLTTFQSTGWQTYTYTAGSNGAEGYAGFVVADVHHADVALLVDNLSQCGQPGNQGFEFDNYTGYTLIPGSNGSVGWSVLSMYDGIYYSTEGNYMSIQYSNNSPAFEFINAYGSPAMHGSILETPISLAPNESFTFDWAFLAFAYTDSEDFAKFFLRDSEGNIVFQDGLAQMGPGPSTVPLPPTALLFGSGLLGLLGWKKFLTR
jgi:hypothetical protein